MAATGTGGNGQTGSNGATVAASYRYPELPKVPDGSGDEPAVKLGAGAIIAVYHPGTDVLYGANPDDVRVILAPHTNFVRGGQKVFTDNVARNQFTAAYPELLTIGTLASVDNGAAAEDAAAGVVTDSASYVLVRSDDSADQLLPADPVKGSPAMRGRWVLADSPEAQQPYSLAFNPQEEQVLIGEVRSYEEGGVVKFWNPSPTALYLENEEGGLPAPFTGSTRWKEASPAGAATMLSLTISVAVARELPGAGKVRPIQYLLERRNESGSLPTVAIRGISPDGYNLADALEWDGTTWLPVTYDLDNDETAPRSSGGGGVAGVSSVNSRSGAVTLSKSDVGLPNADNTSDASKPVSTAQAAAISAASTADRARANHTGSQPATTITGLATVATSGSYNDLTSKPTIPAATTIVNTLTQTAAGTALDGRQGKVLADRVQALEYRIDPDTGAIKIDMPDAGGVLEIFGLDVLTFQFRATDGTITPYFQVSSGGLYFAPGGGINLTSAAGGALALTTSDTGELLVNGQPIEGNALVRPGTSGAGNVLIGDPTDGNSISGGGDASVTVGGLGNTIDSPDGLNAIIGGSVCSVSGTYNVLVNSNTCAIEGGGGNAIYSSQGCTIPAGCENVTLLNCATFTPPVSTTGKTYINNVEVSTPHDIYACADNTTLTTAVVGGTYTNGELQGTQPTGSQAGDEFTTTTYGYKFQRGAAGTLVWCRYPKS